jgi:hypothetical protein
LRNAESKYFNYFSQTPLVFPEIEGVNPEGSGISDWPALGFSKPKIEQNRIFGPK